MWLFANLFRLGLHWASLVHATKFNKYPRYSGGKFPAFRTVMATNALGLINVDISIKWLLSWPLKSTPLNQSRWSPLLTPKMLESVIRLSLSREKCIIPSLDLTYHTFVIIGGSILEGSWAFQSVEEMRALVWKQSAMSIWIYKLDKEFDKPNEHD